MIICNQIVILSQHDSDWRILQILTISINYSWLLYMICIWCAKKQARHALGRSWMVLALSALMDLKALGDVRSLLSFNQWHPMTPRRSAWSSSRTWRKKGGVESYGDGYLICFILSCYLMFFINVETVHPVWSISLTGLPQFAWSC